MNRRGVLLGGVLAMAGGNAGGEGLGAGLGGNHPMRPDQDLNAAHRTLALPPGAQSGTFIGRLVIIKGGLPPLSGLYVYSAGGQLIGSIAAAAGTGPLGGTVLPVISAYQGVNAVSLLNAAVAFTNESFTVNPASMSLGSVSATTSEVLLQSGNSVLGVAEGALTITDANGGLVAGIPAYIFGGTIENTFGSATGRLEVVTNTLSSPSQPMVQWIAAAAADAVLGIEISADSFNRFKIDSNGRVQWGSGAAGQDTDLFRGGAGILQTDSTLAITNQAAPVALAGAGQLYAANGQLAVTNASGLNYNVSTGQPANFNKNSVTGAAFANLSTFNIPAGDPVVGAVYEFRMFGYGQWGNPATQLSLQGNLGGNQFALTAVAAGAFAAAAVFQWNAVLTVTCTATGSGGTWRCSLSGAIQQTANSLNPGTAASNSVAFSLGEGSAADIAGSTLGSLAVQLAAEWASAANGATITKSTSYPVRVA